MYISSLVKLGELGSGSSTATASTWEPWLLEAVEQLADVSEVGQPARSAQPCENPPRKREEVHVPGRPPAQAGLGQQTMWSARH
jgi:hypothetical protein